MTYSSELQKAANKYYHYACKYSKAKSGSSKNLLSNKVEEYRKLTSELFRKEWEEYGKESSCTSCW